MIYRYKRYGKCNREKCQSACCKVLNGKEGIFDEISFTNGVCSKLSNNKCKIYDTRPKVCSVWPEAPNDIIFLKVKKVCRFWFEEEWIKEE